MTIQHLPIAAPAPEVEKFFGKYPGLVLKNDPPDSGNHRGELWVEVPGLLEEVPNSTKERPLQVKAMPCFPPGFFFVPEVGAQVWIEFVAGDINSPLWTGVWYPVDKAPKTFDDQAATRFQKIIRTASGHVVQLDDTEDGEQIVVRHKGDTIVSIDNDKFDITHHSGTLVSIDADGNVAIQHNDGATTIELNEGVVNIIADNIKLDGVVEITGKTTIKENTFIEKDLEVGTGPKTTISKNEITGKL
jgi:phage baseplate assembly protein gpV